MLEPLIDKIQKQIGDKPIELLWFGDNFKMTVGEKRTTMLNIAKGKYINWIDDDDDVVDDYVSCILAALETNPDAVTFESIFSNAGNNTERHLYYERRNTNFNKADGTRYRMLNHITPVKRSHALKIGGFPHANYGEDGNYAIKLFNGHEGMRLLNNVVNIPKVLYLYKFDPEVSRTDKYSPRHNPAAMAMAQRIDQHEHAPDGRVI